MLKIVIGRHVGSYDIRTENIIALLESHQIEIEFLEWDELCSEWGANIFAKYGSVINNDSESPVVMLVFKKTGYLVWLEERPYLEVLHQRMVKYGILLRLEQEISRR